MSLLRHHYDAHAAVKQQRRAVRDAAFQDVVMGVTDTVRGPQFLTLPNGETEPMEASKRMYCDHDIIDIIRTVVAKLKKGDKQVK